VSLDEQYRDIAAAVITGLRPLPPGWHRHPDPHPEPPPPGWTLIGFDPDTGAPLHWRPR
jgi:hypothetical protein